MPFPLSLRGTAFSEFPDVETTLARIEEGLRGQQARSVKRDGDTLRFKGSFMSRRFGGSVLTTISWGTIRVSRSDALIQAEYDLHFLQNHLVRGAIAAVAFGSIYFGIKTADTLMTIAAGTSFWFVLVALDYLLAATMFPRFLAAKLASPQE